MENLTLYFCPLTCARITMVALEHVGATFDTKLINVMAGAQRSPDYLAINPAGKVPALVVGDRVLTENSAIILYLDGLYPEAGLLPASLDPLTVAQARADLIWCSTTLHPLARQIRAPMHYTLGATEDVIAKGKQAIAPIMASLDQKFARRRWWFGDSWSIVDMYLAWVGGACASGGFDLSPYPQVVAHSLRTAEQPAFQLMYAREGAIMAAAELHLPPGMTR